jgi:hypothetical protein
MRNILKCPVKVNPSTAEIAALVISATNVEILHNFMLCAPPGVLFRNEIQDLDFF